MRITANATFHGHELSEMPVLNPGAWWGKTWLIEIGGSYTPLFLIIEADSMCDAIDELASHDNYGHNIVVADEDLGDYDLETCHFGPSGEVLDLDNLMIYGQERSDCPFPCRYFGDGLPAKGIEPKDLDEYDLEEEAAEESK